MKKLPLNFIAIVVISVILSIGGVYLLKDSLGLVGPEGPEGPQGEQGIEGERGFQGEAGVSVTKVKYLPANGRWLEYCLEEGFIKTPSFWCSDPFYLWSK